MTRPERMGARSPKVVSFWLTAFASLVLALVLEPCAGGAVDQVSPPAALPSMVDGGARVDLVATKRQLAASRSIEGTPLAVNTQNYADEGSPAFNRAWNERQARLAAWSDDSLHVVAAQSGHGIPDDAPELVVASVSEVVSAVQSSSPLAACSNRFAQFNGRCWS